jgi:DNA polymerase IV
MTATTERIIAHIDMDAFFVSVEEVLDPTLKGKPVVVGGDPDGRGVVSAASYKARQYGIHSAMPLAQARRLCPDAIFLRGSMSKYSEFSHRIFAILSRYSPVVEPVSVDEAYIDLSGCERLHGPILTMVQRIRDEILNTVGVSASAGIASNKLLAKIASGFCKPAGMLWIVPGKEQRFLQALPVRRIPGVGVQAEKELLRIGKRKIGEVACMPQEKLEKLFGKWGTALAMKSRGLCDHPVAHIESDSRSISRETTLKTDSRDLQLLRSLLSHLLEKTTNQLRQSKLYAKSITVKIRHSDFKTESRSKTLDTASAEDSMLLNIADGLFQNALATNTKHVRLIGVCLSSLTHERTRQTSLFDSDHPEQNDQLYKSLDRIRVKYGFRSIKKARSFQAP